MWYTIRVNKTSPRGEKRVKYLLVRKNQKSEHVSQGYYFMRLQQFTRTFVSQTTIWLELRSVNFRIWRAPLIRPDFCGLFNWVPLHFKFCLDNTSRVTDLIDKLLTIKKWRNEAEGSVLELSEVFSWVGVNVKQRCHSQKTTCTLPRHSGLATSCKESVES